MKKRIWISKENKWEALTQKNYLNKNKLEIKSLKNGIILPPKHLENGHYAGGACSEDFNFIGGLTLYDETHPEYPGWAAMAKSYKTSDVEKSSEEVIFGGVIYNHFGHFLLDGLSRLWYLVKYPQDKRKVAFVVISWDNADEKLGSVREFNYEFLKMLGLNKERILIINKATKFAKIIVPQESHHAYFNYSKEWISIYQKLAESADKICQKEPKFDKIFLSHKKWLGSCGVRSCECVNEDLFEEFFSKLGFEVIYPEELSIARQIYLAHNAKQIASTIGTTTHFALFCKPNTQFFMLIRILEDPLIPQIIINQASRIDWHIISTDRNFLHANRTWGPLNLDFTDDFIEFCEKILGKKAANLARKFAAKTSSNTYIKAWAEWYAKPSAYANIAKITAFDMLNRFCVEFLGKSLKIDEFAPPPHLSFASNTIFGRGYFQSNTYKTSHIKSYRFLA